MPLKLPTATKLFLNFLMRLTVGNLKLTTPEGNHLTFGNVDQQPSATLNIHDWRACTRIFRAGDIGFAESIEAGWIDSPDLSAVLHLALLNETELSRLISGGKLATFWYRLRHLLRPVIRKNSRHNIQTHYDLTNDFYALWLGDSMTNSSAIFDGEFSLSLRDAHAKKYQRIIDVLGLKAGDHVLELGCGWGGFATYAADLGIYVTGITSCTSQLECAKDKINLLGLQSRMEIYFRDFEDLGEDLTRKYDAVVSIELLETLGERNWSDYFNTIASCLNNGGRALIQSVTIPERDFERYRSSTDFIQQYIYPITMLPSAERLCSYAGAAGLETVQQFFFGRDYAETFRRWSAAFDRENKSIAKLGYDARFMRIWRLYLAYCEARFDGGKTDVAQFLLRKL